MTTYLLRQPKTLESLATDKLAAWIATQAKELTSPNSELHQYGATKAEAKFSRKIEIIRNYFNREMPKKCHNYLLSRIIIELILLFSYLPSISKYENLWYKSVSQTKVIKRMIESLFTNNLTSLSLNFNQFTIFRDSLLSKSYLLTGLINLHLNFETLANSHRADDTVVKVTTNIIYFLEDLHSLQNLTINYICTDDILRCIAKNCKLIEVLNVVSSKEINDDSMVILTQLHNLRSINLDKTSVGRRGIETILLSFKNIEHIVIPDTVNKTHKIPYVLEQIANSEEKFPKLFKIKAYRGYGDTSEQLQLLIQMCPLIQNLHIRLFTRIIGQCDMKAITGLRGLSELTLEGYVLDNEHIKQAFQVIGLNLTHLHLLKFMQIDLRTLLEISEVCPNLTSLSLHNCTFRRQAPLDTRDLRAPSFQNLKKLILDTSSSFDTEFDVYFCSNVRHVFSNQAVEESRFDATLQLIQLVALILLSNCLDVEFIQVSRSAWFTEDLMLKVLDKNPLKQLKELKICEHECRSPIRLPHGVTAAVLDRIIQNCMNRPQVIRVLEGTSTSLDGSNEISIPIELLTL